MSKPEAIEFIKKVQRRAEGEIESPYIENLLMYNPMYEKYPVKELLQGFKQKFYCNGSGKAKGVSFEISAPKSWKSKEAYRPNIVRKFTSQNGFGRASISILIRKLPVPDDMILSNQDIQDYIITDELIKTVQKDILLKDYGRFFLEGLPGYWQKIDMNMDRGENKIKAKSKFYTFYYQNKMIMIQYFVVNVNKEMTNKKHLELFNKYEPIFNLVVNSFVLPDKYK